MKRFFAIFLIIAGCDQVIEETREVTCTAGGDLVVIKFDNIRPSEAKDQMHRMTKGIKELEGTVICH